MDNVQTDCHTLINQLIADFRDKPLSYFSECELQYDLYCLFKASDLNQSASTNDDIQVSTIHPEYPSVNRIQLNSGKGYRVWFDLAILNPDFIRSNTFSTVWARDERTTRSWGENLLAAFEFKYFSSARTHNLMSVQQDCMKLSLCQEIAHRYVLVFSEYEIEDSALDVIKPGLSKLIWITPQHEYTR